MKQAVEDETTLTVLGSNISKLRRLMVEVEDTVQRNTLKEVLDDLIRVREGLKKEVELWNLLTERLTKIENFAHSLETHS